MSIGAILFGVAVTLVVAAYLARPFRAARTGADLDRLIEVWVAQSRAKGRPEEWPSHCAQCGRRVGPADRFCARCGAPLRERQES